MSLSTALIVDHVYSNPFAQMLRAVSPYSALCETVLRSYDSKQACPWLTRTY